MHNTSNPNARFSVGYSEPTPNFLTGQGRTRQEHQYTVVLDCQLPGLAGPEVAREIRQRGLPTRVLALSAYRYEHYIRGTLEAGAVGYLLKEEAPEAIVEAVRAAVQGRGYFSPGVADLVQAILEGRARRR